MVTAATRSPRTIHVPTAGVSGAMASTHLLIGIGEGLIAATTVATVARVRPDLVYALRRFRPPPPVAEAAPAAVSGGVR